jgi:hypothetical protein
VSATLASRLGHPDHARLVILHVDDVGMCHGANTAFLELARAGHVTCGSAMVPCPWFPEIAEAAAKDRTLDLGIHLTLTSEWAHYRWRPLSTASPASGLIDADGYMWRSCLELRRHLVIEAAEAELRAQIDRAIASGLAPTHLDTHMGAALAPELLPVYLRLGESYRLPVLLPRNLESYTAVLRLGEIDPMPYRSALAAFEQRDLPIIDQFRMTPGVPSEAAEQAYRAMIADLPPGVTFFALHCNAPGDIETIVPPRAHWRTDEYRLFGAGTVRRWLEDAGIATIGMRPLIDLLPK